MNVLTQQAQGKGHEPGSHGGIAVVLLPFASPPLPENKPMNCWYLDFLQ